MAYLELYVADDDAVVAYFARSLMFDQVAVARHPTQRSTLLRSSTVQVIVTAPTAEDGPVADYLARHGDGVADVALHHTDLHELVRRAQAAGLNVLAPVRALSVDGTRTARISGAGSVHHTLLDTTSHQLRLPPGFAWEAEHLTFPAPVTSRASMIRPQMVDHLTWYLPAEALEPVTTQYREAFGMRIASNDQTTAGTTVANSYILSTASMVFVLVAADRARQPQPGGPIDDFLAAHASAGVQRIAFHTGDIVAAARMHLRNGDELIPAPTGYYDHIPALLADCPPVRARMDEMRALGVLVDHDNDGPLFQIVARSPHQRGTLRYELIQRQGSTGFGRRNARALLLQTHQTEPPDVPQVPDARLRPRREQFRPALSIGRRRRLGLG
ncbi:hypothetical protein [Spirillospora sp. CA-128828]|uniref:hypothetical protein n=1 Tax=Spirillospora sp. CA-128828 TaxID=3240033 RepID=UPI003D943F8E